MTLKRKINPKDLKIVQYGPSPNTASRGGDTVQFLIEHFTATPSTQVALDVLTDGKSSNRVSSHYVVDPSGKIYQLVDEKLTAWHAGLSFWQGVRNLNSTSIGIEIQNVDGNFNQFPQAQIDAVIALSQWIVQRYKIRALHVIGHSDIAPNRKDDPGSKFPWQQFADNGLGMWPSPIKDDYDTSADWNTGTIRQKLIALGYMPDQKVATRDLVVAFQRHWRQEAIGTSSEGSLDGEGKARLACLLRRKASADAISAARRGKRRR